MFIPVLTKAPSGTPLNSSLAPRPNPDQIPNLDQLIRRLGRDGGQPLLPQDINFPAHFHFKWAGLSFMARLDRLDAGYRLDLKACLGRLPYSAEDFEARQKAQALLAGSYKILDGAYDLNANGDLMFRAATSLEDQLTPEYLLQAITITLLQLKRHLKAFDGLLHPIFD